ncbi:hypothetical protein GOBAR_DD05710 [Gossypium barbadense]|nr:hypothetical protein GOBAR_DD05710 [Gossypium barbadense]
MSTALWSVSGKKWRRRNRGDKNVRRKKVRLIGPVQGHAVPGILAKHASFDGWKTVGNVEELSGKEVLDGRILRP